MNDTDALTLLAKIEATWPANGRRNWPQVDHDVWRDMLADLDAGAAGTALVRLMRKTPTDRPKPGEFRTEAAGLHTHDASNPAEVCSVCGGDQWVTDEDHPRHHGYWAGKEGHRPVAMTANGPDPTECLCNIARPCPKCNPQRKDRAA